MAIASKCFVASAAATDDFVASAVRTELESTHPSRFVVAEAEPSDFLMTTIGFVVVAATPFDFGASAPHIGYALGHSSRGADGAAGPFQAVAVAHEGKRRASTRNSF